MPLLNYTTKIDANKTCGELQLLLVKAGCQSVTFNFEAGQPSAVTFGLDVVPNQPRWHFTLPCNVEGVLRVLKRQSKVPRSACTMAQAQRVAWRIIKDWCAAQLAIIEAGQATMAEVFLPYLQTPTGQTLYQALETGNLKLLN